MVGNHLLQHRELSATAIGVAAYIQSLPEGAPVGIRALVARFPEGEMRMSSALRELERHGYLERRTERLSTGRVATRTYSYNQPRPAGPPPLDEDPDPDSAPAPDPREAATAEPSPTSTPSPTPTPTPSPTPSPSATPPPAQKVHPAAAELLAGLRRHDPRLLLPERDVRRLAPAASAWLDRGADPEAIRKTLTANLPDQLRSPASLLAYRLQALLPAHLPAPPPPTPVRRPDPFQTCDGCDRAFRAPTPGRCRDCPPPESRAA
ncbi:helix-turn-helix domain-containing protein [Streptomyces sp. NPDC051109]|uniref:helix-turn-helix domain-containing protein n=1 Tax=Streptomyces sp. NPDC051109 TaxID=3365642 RepID=UPI00379A8EC4